MECSLALGADTSKKEGQQHKAGGPLQTRGQQDGPEFRGQLPSREGWFQRGKPEPAFDGGNACGSELPLLVQQPGRIQHCMQLCLRAGTRQGREQTPRVGTAPIFWLAGCVPTCAHTCVGVHMHAHCFTQGNVTSTAGPV